MSKGKEIFPVTSVYGHKKYAWKTLPIFVPQVISFNNSRSMWWWFLGFFVLWIFFFTFQI